MTRDIDTLKAALQAAPAPDGDARQAALRLAMENFDRLQPAAQGSADDTRLSMDRPGRAGLGKVWTMITNLATRPIFATATSVAALCLVAFVAVPLLQRAPGPLVLTGAPEPVQPQLTTPRPEEKDAVATTGLGRVATLDDASALAPMAQEPVDELAKTESLADAGAVTDITTGADALAGATTTAPAPTARIAAPTTAQQDGTLALLAESPVFGLAAPAALDALTPPPPTDTEAFANAPANPVHVTAENPVSTFAAEVDTAAWSVIRSSLNAGWLPPAQAVRVEEMVNYFPYAYPEPQGDLPFAAAIAVMPTPWNAGTQLVRIGLQGTMPAVEDRPALNLVFLIDTSGSMDEPAKLPLLRQSLRLMLGRLSPQDRLAIVTYAGSAGQVLPPTPASDRAAIEAALNRLDAGGSTAGADGIALAYQVAKGMSRDGAVSRVLLATDGDFNVGVSDPEALKTLIADQRDTGIYLSVLGFGRGNLDDATMQALAQNGNGTASYIDTLAEAQKVLGDQLTGALFPIADDVKIQVEWNPARVAEYRLIGYETRSLRREDFNNDRIDAGEVGAGLQVTALYEVTPPDSPALLNNPLRYGPAPADGDGLTEMGFLRLRWKAPGETASQLAEVPITGQEPADDEARFAAAIAGFGQLLAGSPYLGTWGWDQMIALASDARGADPYGYRAEAVTLMRLAASLGQ